MKTLPQNIRIIFWVLLGIALLVSSLALNRPLPQSQDATNTPAQQAGTIVARGEAIEDAGSTDEIMLMASIIVLIIITPILIRRKTWSNKKRK